MSSKGKLGSKVQKGHEDQKGIERDNYPYDDGHTQCQSDRQETAQYTT